MTIGTEIMESYKMAMAALAAHKMRSALTLLGVLVGVFSIIVVMTAMRALQSVIETELSQLGAHTFVVSKWPAMMVGGGPEDWEKFWRRKPIRYSTIMQLKERATLARNVGAECEWMWAGEAMSPYAKTNPNIPMHGVTPEVFEARNWIIQEGRALQPTDLDSARNVCVLGNQLAKKMYPFGSAVHRTVKYRGINFTIVGVLAAKGGAVGGDQDSFLAIPLTTGMNRSYRDRTIDILVQAKDRATFEDTVEQVRGILRTLRKVPPGKADDFEINSNDSLIKQFKSLTLAIRIGVSAISFIALLAAGIGIMNIMLVSVTERTREIGIRRAVGAKKRNIMVQFIMEAIAICEVGGVFGVGLGILGGNLAAFFLRVPAVIPVD